MQSVNESRRSDLIIIASVLALLIAGAFSIWWINRESEADAAPESTSTGNQAESERQARRSREAAPLHQSDPSVKKNPSSERLPTTLRVIDADGTPLPKARLDIYRSDGVHFALTCDGKGVARTPQRSAPALIFVLAPGWTPQRFDAVSLAEEEQTLRLKAGPKIEGLLFHDEDGRAAAGLEVRLIVSGLAVQELKTGLGVRDAVALQDVWTLGLRSKTDVRGRFVFRGLPAAGNWSATLEAPRGYDFLDDRGAPIRPTFTEAPTGLRLPLVQLPRLTMRFVAGPDRRPVPGISVEFAHDRGRSPDFTNSSFATSDDEGRVVIDVAARQFHGLMLAIPRGDGPSELRRIEPFSGTKDLGEIELPARRDLSIKVTDAQGAPLAGAFVGIAKSTTTAGPSDATGRCFLPNIPAKALIIEATAAGMKTGRVQVTAQQVDATIALSPGNALTVLSFQEDGKPLPRASIAIEWPGDMELFGNSGLAPSALGRRTLVGDLQGGRSRAEQRIAHGKTSAKGEFRAHDLNFAVPFQVHLLGDYGEIIASSGDLKLGAVGSQTIELHQPRLPERHLEVLVVDLENRPIKSAWVRACALHTRSGARFISAKANDEGTARLPRPPEGSIQLSAGAEGFTRSDATIELKADTTTPLRLQLARKDGRLLITLIDAANRPASGKVFWRQEADSDIGTLTDYGNASFVAPGLYEVRGLQPAPVQLDIHVGGQRFEQKVPADTPEVDLQLPPPGRLLVRWQFPLVHSQEIHRVTTQRGPRPVECYFNGSDAVSNVALEGMMPGSATITLQRWSPDNRRFIDVSESIKVTIKSKGSEEIELSKKSP